MIVPHCGGAVPVLADRINEFMRLFLPSEHSSALDAVQQLRGLLLRHGRHRLPTPGSRPARTRRSGPRAVRQRLLLDPAAGPDAHIAAIDAAESPTGTTWRSLTTANAQRLFPRLAHR